MNTLKSFWDFEFANEIIVLKHDFTLIADG